MRARLADDERWRAWVLDIDGALAGAVWLEFVEKLPNPNGEPELHAYVTSFYVNPMHRNVGAGSRLLAALLDDCRSARVDAVFLWPSERSRPLYERNGFIAASNMFVREL
jgi:GNAT superfamily N-acetyltransferase